MNEKYIENQFKILMTVIMIICSGCIENNNNNFIKKELKYVYQIEINNNNLNEYIIYLPIPLLRKNISEIKMENDSVVDQIINNITVLFGQCMYNIIDTSYGKAINITSSKSVLLTSKGKLNWLDMFSNLTVPIYLSMFSKYNKTNSAFFYEKYWVYSSIDGVNIKITLETEKGSACYANYKSINLNIIKGWQIIDIKEKVKIP
jgi:hypothetical protein